MFKPSYLSAQGPYGAYGADEVTPPAESTSEKTTWGTRLTNTQATITTAQDTLTTVQETADSAKGLWDTISAPFMKKKKTTPPPPPDMFEKYKAIMTAVEYAQWTTGVKTTCGKRPHITKIKATSDYMLCAQKLANSILNARTTVTPTVLTPTSLTTNEKTVTTEEPNYTWYYVGGAAGVLALGAAAWYFGIYRPKHK